jgi:hypothetical protein
MATGVKKDEGRMMAQIRLELSALILAAKALGAPGAMAALGCGWEGTAGGA